MDKCSNVAVYGTLKRGFHANRKLRGCGFVGAGVTSNTFAMTDCGFPMLRKDTEGNKVSVEVYHGPDFSVLDMYEGVPSLYTREVVAIELADGSTVNAWIYIGEDIHGADVEPDAVGVLSWPAAESSSSFG